MNFVAQRKLAVLSFSACGLLMACTNASVDGSSDPSRPSSGSAQSTAAAPSDPAAATAPTTNPLTRAWTSRVSAVSAPISVGNRVVLYAKTKQGLALVGLDAETGRERWRLPAATAATDPDLAPAVGMVEHGKTPLVSTIVADQRADRWRVVTLSAGSGKVVAKSRPLWVTSWPAACSDGPQLCFTGWTETGADATFRMKPRSGAVQVPQSPPRAAPTPSVMDGWRFTPTDQETLQLATRAPKRMPQRKGWRAAWRTGAMAAVSSTSGQSVWELSGTAPGCAPNLPQGTVCTGEGETRSKAGKVTVTGTDLALTRLDLASGKQLWTLGLSADALRGGVLRSAIAADGKTVLDLGAGAQLVDLKTGEVSAVDPALRFACSVRPTVKIGGQERTAAARWRTCTSTLRATKRQDFSTTAEAIGTPAGELFVVVGTDRVFGYR